MQAAHHALPTARVGLSGRPEAVEDQVTMAANPAVGKLETRLKAVAVVSVAVGIMVATIVAINKRADIAATIMAEVNTVVMANVAEATVLADLATEAVPPSKEFAFT